MERRRLVAAPELPAADERQHIGHILRVEERSASMERRRLVGFVEDRMATTRRRSKATCR